MKNENLFQSGNLTLHSGKESNFKINCDALLDSDIETIARLIAKRYHFHGVVGVPTGGLRLANALLKYREPDAPLLLIVDDVLTTGASIQEEANNHKGLMRGVVIFSRQSHLPAWITPVFKMDNF